MRKLIMVLISILATMTSFSQNKPGDRYPVASGRFYSSDKDNLLKDISGLFASCEKPPYNSSVRAIISPHAGYVYSGKIAAAAYSAIPGNSLFKNIFLIGSSHVMSFDGASVYHSGDYITPLGKVPVNLEIANKLISENKVFGFPENAHIEEHSLEVQLPFIQYYFTNKPLIVPVILGTNNENTIKEVAEALRPWFTSDNLFVISSDFSHYPPYKEAVNVDKLTALSIVSGNSKTFLTTLKKNSQQHIRGLATSMCGWTSGLTLLYLAEGNNRLEFRLIDYCNSGDSPYGEKNEVVGYNAIAVIEKIDKEVKNETIEDEFSFNDEERAQLFNIARSSILTKLQEKKSIGFEEKSMPFKIQQPLGAFVTLKIDGILRGCIGRFISSDPLYRVVEASAVSSAFEDPRFTPLTLMEYEKASIEITVLGPLKRINNINEIVLGKHGIYIKKEFNSGTMLPQVAIENGWTVEEFLGYTSRDKAGIGWDGWKEAEIYIYEGIVLEENK